MIDGLSIFPRFLDEASQQRLVTHIDAARWSHTLARRTMHFGWTYSYDRRPLNADDYLGPMPHWMNVVATLIEPAFSSPPDQAIINNYEPGQGIGAHIDHTTNFGPVVASLSLLSNAVIIFSRGSVRHSVRLSPGDLLVLERDARFRWTHAIPRHDERRISVTFRTIQQRTT